MINVKQQNASALGCWAAAARAGVSPGPCLSQRAAEVGGGLEQQAQREAGPVGGGGRAPQQLPRPLSHSRRHLQAGRRHTGHIPSCFML